MQKIGSGNKHNCLLSSPAENKSSFFLTRLQDAYLRKVQDFSQWLFQKGWVLPSLLVPSFFGEPLESGASAIRRLRGWKSSWEKYGFYDAGDPKSLEKLKAELKSKGSSILTPVLLFHGVFSTPDIWLPWAPTLQKAVKENRIGCIITAQLPNPLKERMEVVNRVIGDVINIYKEAHGPEQVDIIGHSKGGYAGHLAAFKKVRVFDKLDIERRWHNLVRKETVRKVISVAAPTWLCCKGQHDETTQRKPNEEDIYPLKIFKGTKSIEGAFKPHQLETIRKYHPNIFDIVATQDAISPVDSPLPKDQIIYVKHGHLGVTTCPKVCEFALSILAPITKRSIKPF